MMQADQEHPVVILDAAESWDLLAGSELGRLAVSVGDQPEIFPINYLAHDGVVLFRTAQGSKLVSLTINRYVALETDGYTADTAWSVVVKGTARALDRDIDIDVAAKLPLHSWIPTIKYVFVEITPDQITGRRFARGPEPWR
ncbi:pyridoxamine 5'-phosphate oxidase family protein [Arthrobacter celericrescens]|nr:pyridoxamine 5'-phosphate oxidase family protein [Arthrobacter celericrescens]